MRGSEFNNIDLVLLDNPLDKQPFFTFPVYHDFIAGYLNMLRQRENKPPDWTPETFFIDSELADGMQHFFSDYQHITKAFYRLNREMDHLREIDKDKQLNLYQHMIDDILKRQDRQITPGDEYENTG